MDLVQDKVMLFGINDKEEISFSSLSNKNDYSNILSQDIGKLVTKHIIRIGAQFADSANIKIYRLPNVENSHDFVIKF